LCKIISFSLSSLLGLDCPKNIQVQHIKTLASFRWTFIFIIKGFLVGLGFLVVKICTKVQDLNNNNMGERLEREPKHTPYAIDKNLGFGFCSSTVLWVVWGGGGFFFQ
jgi:hypothetical protein